MDGFLLKALQFAGAGFFLWLIVSFEQWLIRLAKRYLPRGSRIRKWVLWTRADEPN